MTQKKSMIWINSESKDKLLYLKIKMKEKSIDLVVTKLLDSYYKSKIDETQNI